MAYIKKNSETNVTSNKKAQTNNVEKVEAKKVIKQYTGEDLIPCKSMTKGELIYVGKKSGEIYRWSDFGDITEVEYQDLLGLKAKKSAFIYDTMFVILDDELLEDPKWSDVRKIYEKIYSDDVQELLDMPIGKFKEVFPGLPNGLKKATVVEAGTQMENGTFDSIQKIKFIDETCGTDLSSML